MVVRSGGSSVNVARRLRVVSHDRDAKPGKAGNDATGCSLVGSRAIARMPREPEVLGKHFHGAMRGARVAVDWRQVQHVPADAVARHAPAADMGRFCSGAPGRHNRRMASYETGVSESVAGAACDLMRRIGSGSASARHSAMPGGPRLRHDGAATTRRGWAVWIVAGPCGMRPVPDRRPTER